MGPKLTSKVYKALFEITVLVLNIQVSLYISIRKTLVVYETVMNTVYFDFLAKYTQSRCYFSMSTFSILYL